ncbi:hypothetical protein OG216_12315 [Streptomycetaceae bacterium NBC_01309]
MSTQARFPRLPRPVRRARSARALAVGVAAAALLSACGVEGKAKAQPVPDKVCSDLLDTGEVTALLPPGKPTVRDEQRPIFKYPLQRCEVTVDGVSFVGSAYLPNMAGAELVQLAGSTGSSASPFVGDNFNGMAGPDDVWITTECTLGITDEAGLAVKAPVVVRGRLVGDPAADRREQLGALTRKLAAGVYDASRCGQTAPANPAPIAPAPPRLPLTDAPICDVLPPSALGAAAAGDQRSRWTAARTPGREGYVQTCDLYLDGVRALSFTVAHGYIAPSAEIPGERPRLSQRLPVPPDSTPAPPKDTKVTTATPPGTVVGAVDGTGTKKDATTGEEASCRVAYRMSRHDGPGLPADVAKVPTEAAFRAFVAGASVLDYTCPVTPDAQWTFG